MVRAIQQQTGLELLIWLLRNKNGWNPAMLALLLDCSAF